MQFMIADGDVELPPRFSPPVWLISKVIETPPVTRPPPPSPPEPRDRAPETVIPGTGPTTVRVPPDGPVTPPGPPIPSVVAGGRQGPWINDAGHMLIARIEPAYPQRAIIRELEGIVRIEFTITRQGTVTDVRILESTDSIFEASAAAAVARTRYRPRIVEGEPVETTGVTTEIEFRFED